MASSVKVILHKKKENDGTHPLAIRITIDRKRTYIYLGFKLQEKDWDEPGQKVRKSHPNSTRLNNLILKKKADASDRMIELQSRDNALTLKNVRTKIKPKVGITFFAQAKVFVENKKIAGKYNQEKPDQSRIDGFKTFLNGEDITFDEITIPLLNRFRAYLKGVRKLSERSIINHLLIIRTIYNQAVNSEIIDKKKYPFGKEKVQIKFPDSLKVGLTLDEVKQIEQVDLSDNSYLNHARNLWLFSFYFAGIRFSDLVLMKWSDFQNDRLFYSMGKNLKPGSLKVPEKALRIIEQYRNDESKNDLIFPELKVIDDLEDTYNVQRKTSYADKSVNEALEKVANRIELTKPLTMHISRHTFGNISGDKIDVKMLQKLYRHSDIRTTIGYQANFIHKTADDALDAVIGN